MFDGAQLLLLLNAYKSTMKIFGFNKIHNKQHNPTWYHYFSYQFGFLDKNGKTDIISSLPYNSSE